MNKNHVLSEITQSALITNSENELLILCLSNWKWVFPWWRLNKWEKWIDWLNREVSEETWITKIEIISILEVDNWENKWTSQYGIFFHCNSENYDVVLSAEHIKYKWVSEKNLWNIDFFHPMLKIIAQKLYSLIKQ